MAKPRFDYFDALANQGEYSCQEARLLLEALTHFDPKRAEENTLAMHEIENAADGQTHELFLHIAKEFITPIDREDIIELAQELDDVVDYIEDVSQQLYMYDVRSVHPNALDMVELIVKVTEALYGALKEFRNFKQKGPLSELIIVVNDIEEEADKLFLVSMRDLYKNHTDEPVYIMIWSNMFARMERCIDACEHVADMMATVILKNS
jgi:predicted phosphate transport protein (TIGR00153 family)